MLSPLSFLRRLWPVWCLLLAGVRLAGADTPWRPIGEGQPPVQYWTARDYRGSSTCACLAQDRWGVMYIGNSGQVLEYDGSTWRRIPTGDPGAILGLAYDAATDTVFVGKMDDVGCLRPEPGGTRTYVSLRDQLPPEARGASKFRGVYATAEGVCFVGSDRALRWRDRRFKTWKLPTTGVPYSYEAAGRVYAVSRSMGLLRLEGDEWVSVSTDGRLHEMSVLGLASGPDGRGLMVGTAKDGLFLLREDGTLEQQETDCDAFLKEKTINGMLRLRDGSLAVGTSKGGLVLLDAKLHFRCRLDAGSGGLRADYIHKLFEDAEGGLWVGQFSGVARVEVGSALSIYRAGRDEELTGGSSTDYWDGWPALGVTSGVYRAAPADPAQALSARMEQLAGNLSGGNGLCTVANGLLVLDRGNIKLIDRERRVSNVLEDKSVIHMVESRVHPGRVYFVTLAGRIGSLRLDEAAGGRWVEDATVAELGVPGEFILEESREGDVWAGTAGHGIFRVEPGAAGGGGGKVTAFFDRPGPLRGVGLAFPYNCRGLLVIKTFGGLYRWDESSASIEPLTIFGERFRDGTLNVAELVAQDSRQLWLTAANPREALEGRFAGRVVAAEAGQAAEFQAVPHAVEEIIGRVGTFFIVEPPGVPLQSVLIQGTTGNAMVRLEVPKWEAARNKGWVFAATVRRAWTVSENDAEKEAPILGEVLPYTRNTAHFEYAAGTLAFGVEPRFQTRLAGLGKGTWSNWSDRTSVDYLDLPEGRYTFEVRARDADGHLGRVASMPFRVLPPWQRSPWAYMGYALLAAAGVWALVLWRGRQLHRRNVELETVVAARTGELRAREAELVRARDDAEAANRTKSAFLANMSHELRTPLNAVLGYTQLLLKQADLAPRSRERIVVIGQSGGHLLSLVNEVLDLSKVEAGKLTLSPYDFALGSLLDEMGAAFRPRLAEKGLTFTEKRAPGLPVTVHTDPSRLRQVLFNLLSNAVKFTPQGGVTLAVRPTDDRRVCFEVADTGVGIAPEDQRDIFQAFYQTGESHLSAQGTGLGLTISQRLVELLGGRIELESAPGQGSQFWFELPLLDVEAAARTSPRAARDTALGKITGYEGTTRRLVIVDDLAENRRVLRDFLQPLGFEIEEAADGPGALAACERQAPDAVLLDLRLGVMHGFGVARALRARTAGTRPGIIAISASVFESDRQQAIDAGCDDFLPKPFEEAQLLSVLGQVLGLRWVQEMPVASATNVAGAGATLPAHELELLRKLSRRGDLAAIGHRLQAWRAGDGPEDAEDVARRLEPLLAAYDLEGIDKLLLTIQAHGKD